MPVAKLRSVRQDAAEKECRKKIKAQVPYQLYRWVASMARNRGCKKADVVEEIVRAACRGPRTFERDLVVWALSVREAPNNLHFMADARLEERFEYFKRVNKLGSDSGAVRAALKEAYGGLRRYAGGEKQEVLF